MEVVREIFPKCISSLRSELQWHARAPDLSACDYFLCGHFKAKMYITRPRTIDDLKIRVRKQISAVPENLETCEQVWKSVYAMMNKYFSEVLFETK
jgi:hypothetical protein